MERTRHCSVPCCGEKFGSMYLFPKDPILREEWKTACKIVRKNKFHPVSGRYSRLKAGAVPSLNLPGSIRRKGRRNCVIHTCQKDESQDVTLHFFPKNSGLRHKWASVCQVPGKVSRNTRVCSSHFHDDDFIFGGHGVKILKSGAMPSRNLPVSFPSCRKSRLWSVSSTPYDCDDEESFDSFTRSSSCESEDAWIQGFINEEV